MPRSPTESFGTLPVAYTSYTGPNNPHIEAIADGNINLLQTLYNPAGETFPDYSSLYEHITCKIDLRAFLGVSGSKFRCLFHNDRNPSASIFTSKAGEQFYKCHSSHCGFRGNIRRCVEKLRGCTSAQAGRLLQEVFRLRIEESPWAAGQRQLLEENRRVLTTDLESLYPDLYKNVRRDLVLLDQMIGIAIESSELEEFVRSDLGIVFFASNRHLAKVLNIGQHRTVSKKIANLCFHRLLTKVSQEQIPADLLQRSLKCNSAKGHSSTIGYYCIPPYTDDRLDEAVERARLYQNCPLSRRAATYEGYYRTFGVDIAREIYPQIGERDHHPDAEDRTFQIQEATMAMIGEYGYAVEREILDQVSQGKKLVYGIVKTQFKRSLHEMLQSYNLEMVQLNKPLKERLGIEIPGYPRIIMPRRQDDSEQADEMD